MQKSRMSKARKRRISTWSLVAILGLAFALPLASYSIHWFGGVAVAQDAGSQAVNPRSGFWRAVREGGVGVSTVKGDGANVLMQSGGNDWRQSRDSPLMQKLPWLIAGMAGLLLLYHLIHGRNKLAVTPLSGRRIKRWNALDRMVHWITALSFIALAITGLSMMIGKALLIPLLGKAGFAMWAQTSITVHNVIGPLFSVGIVLMILLWVWYNFPAKGDWQWVKAGGGLFSKNHPSAGRMNFGEKTWFWLVAIGGFFVCLTGIVLVAPAYGISLPFVEGVRAQMQQASTVHTVLTVVWTAIALGHIYIGSLGTEGALEGMSTGYVSEEWAVQHHDLWAAKMSAKGKVLELGTEYAEGTLPDNVVRQPVEAPR
ncbi:MAG: formate dehydrogenase subunit gamma [Granulosicoccus sp.]